MIVHKKLIMSLVFFPFMMREEREKEKRRGGGSVPHTQPGRLVVRDCLRKMKTLGPCFPSKPTHSESLSISQIS